MNKNGIGTLRTLSRVAALAACVSLALASSPALALAPPPTPHTSSAGVGVIAVQFGGIAEIDNGVQTLIIGSSEPANYWAQLTQPVGAGCSNVPVQTVDTVKQWESAATSAMLAGKNVIIYYQLVTCNGSSRNYIELITVQK
jgi:hypothetical protein